MPATALPPTDTATPAQNAASATQTAKNGIPAALPVPPPSNSPAGRRWRKWRRQNCPAWHHAATAYAAALAPVQAITVTAEQAEHYADTMPDRGGWRRPYTPAQARTLRKARSAANALRLLAAQDHRAAVPAIAAARRALESADTAAWAEYCARHA